MGRKAYTPSIIGGWVGHWINLHNDALHDWPREECEDCQRAIAEYGRMPTRRMMLRAYEELKRPAFKQPIPAKLRRTVLERDNYTCRQCGARENLAVDHIYPEVWGGQTTLDNLQTLCRPCNSRKSDRKP
jgi:5-methylcytosine-specific restriction endonuclease McrA